MDNITLGRWAAGAATIVGCALAMSGAAWAQSGTPPMSSMPDSSMFMTHPTLLVDEDLDYKGLFNPTYSYGDILYAKTVGMEDDDVARAVKIAEQGGLPFRCVVDRYAVGISFDDIALSAGVAPGALRHIQKEKDAVSAFEAASTTDKWYGPRYHSIESLLAGAAMNGPAKR